MSLSGPSRQPSAGVAGALIATRSLAALDELGVPYLAEEPNGPGGQWACLRALDPDRSLRWFIGHGGELADGWSLGSIRIWARVASDATVAALASSSPGDWVREAPIVDRDGEIRSWVWRASNGGTILPFDPDQAIVNLRSERYLGLQRRRAKAFAEWERRAYYGIRPLLPRSVQIALRRASRARCTTWLIWSWSARLTLPVNPCRSSRPGRADAPGRSY